jgi:hypothetical protein
MDRGEAEIRRHLDVVVTNDCQILRQASARVSRRFEDANG